MEIYALTQRGHALARSTNNPNNPNWKIIHYLDLAHYADRKKISENCHLGDGDIAVAIMELRKKGIITDVSEVSV